MAPGRFLRAAGDCQGEERLVKEGVSLDLLRVETRTQTRPR